MDKITKGTWVINTNKHLLNVKQNTPELSYFEATEVAGKAGMLLARLVADEQEVVPAAKVKVFARESGITGGEFAACLAHLKKVGKVDFTIDEENQPKDVEIYCFSMEDALLTTSDLFNKLNASEYESASIIALDTTFHLPRSKSEIKDTLISFGYSEEIAETTIKLQDTFELVRSVTESSEPIYYNEYAFAGNPGKIVKALDGLKAAERSSVVQIQEIIEEKPGYPLEFLKNHFPSHILSMMEGVGLLDALSVRSDIGEAIFLTLPQLKGISIGVPPISADVFHKAKILLGSLRFGELKSRPTRGKIATAEKMINIVKKLIRGEWVGPCTAIGHDYQLLEKDGVVVTKPAKEGMYFMKLRQKEVGIIVQQLLEFKRAYSYLDMKIQKLLEKQPIAYTIPERRRSQILARVPKPVRMVQERLMEAFRSGMK